VMVSRPSIQCRAGCTFTWLNNIVVTIARVLAASLLSVGGFPGQIIFQSARSPGLALSKLALTFKIERM
jgi:hypothetical protein